MRIRIIILFLVSVSSIWYLDFPYKISEIKDLKAKLLTLDKQSNVTLARPSTMFLIKDERGAVEMLQDFISYCNHQGILIKKISNVQHVRKNGFQETRFSLQIIGDFIPLMTTFEKFDSPILLQHFTMDIEDNMALMKTNISIFHVKSKLTRRIVSFGTLTANGANFSIHILSNGKILWRKI